MRKICGSDYPSRALRVSNKDIARESKDYRNS